MGLEFPYFPKNIIFPTQEPKCHTKNYGIVQDTKENDTSTTRGIATTVWMKDFDI